MRRKYAGNVRFGIVFIVMGSIVATIMTIAISMLVGSIKEFEDKGWDSSKLLSTRTAFSLIVLAIMTTSVFVVGIYMLARGLIGQKVKRNGKKSSCTITQLRYRRRYRASDSFSVIARYKGASGKEYEYVSATTFNPPPKTCRSFSTTQ